MSKLVTLAVFTFILLMGAVSSASAHDNAAPHYPTTINTAQQADASPQVDCMKTMAKQEEASKTKDTSKCPCGKDCSQCKCSMSACCKFIGKPVSLKTTPFQREESHTLADYMISDILPETLPKPPKHS